MAIAPAPLPIPTGGEATRPGFELFDGAVEDADELQRAAEHTMLRGVWAGVVATTPALERAEHAQRR